MRTLLFLLIFLPMLLAAQSGEPVADTSYFVREGATFYEVRRVHYEGGSEMQTKSPIGDTAALVQAAQDRVASQATRLSVDVRHTSTASQQISDWLRECEAVRALTGIDPVRAMQADVAAPLLAGGWKVGDKDIAFALSASGALTYSVAGAAPRPALALGAALRLKKWTGGGDLDLFLLPEGEWVNGTREVTMRATGERSVAPAPVRGARKGG